MSNRRTTMGSGSVLGDASQRISQLQNQPARLSLAPGQLQTKSFAQPPPPSQKAASQIPAPRQSLSGARLSMAPGSNAAPVSSTRSSSGRPSVTSVTAEMASLQLQENANAAPSTGSNNASRRMSQIPAPSTRASLAGRPSLAPNEAANGARRQSVSRRSSMHGKVSHSAVLPPSITQIVLSSVPITAVNGTTKDPRPVREKNFQVSCTRALIEFLAVSNYEKSINSKILFVPSAKDVQYIFMFLYKQLDPCYEFQKKFEEEVPVILKTLRYPFANDIGKSHLHAVGAPHAWPIVLAMLSWMVELIVACDMLAATDENVDPIALAQDESSSNELVFYHFLAKSYHEFIMEDKDPNEVQKELIEAFQVKSQSVAQSVEELRARKAELLAELEALQGDSPLVLAQKKRKILTEDREKFEKYNPYLMGKRSKLQSSLEKLRADLAELQIELNQRRAKRDEYQAKVDAQPISPEDIDRMNADKEALAAQLDSWIQHREESLNQLKLREQAFEKALESVDAQIHQYQDLCNRFASAQATADSNSRHSEISLFQLPTDLEAHSDPLEWLRRIRDHVKPALSHWIRRQEGLRHVREEANVGLGDALDRLIEQCTDKRDELKRLEVRVEKLNAQYAEERQAVAEEQKRSEAEMETLEADLRRMKLEGTSTLLHTQQQLQKLTIEYDQLQCKYSADIERVVRHIFDILTGLIDSKSQMEASFSALDAALEQDLAAYVTAEEANV